MTELPFDPPCSQRKWEKITEPGFTLVSKTATRVEFEHGGFRGIAVIVEYNEDNHEMTVYEDFGDEEPVKLGVVDYPRPHRHPRSSWRGTQELMSHFGGYHDSGFILGNYWSRRAHQDPLSWAVYKLCFARQWYAIRHY